MTLKQIRMRIVEIEMAIELASNKKERQQIRKLVQERDGLITRAKKNFGVTVVSAKHHA